MAILESVDIQANLVYQVTPVSQAYLVILVFLVTVDSQVSPVILDSQVSPVIQVYLVTQDVQDILVIALQVIQVILVFPVILELNL